MSIYTRLQGYFHQPLVEYLFDFNFEIAFGPLVLSAGFDLATFVDQPELLRGEGYNDPAYNPPALGALYDFRPKLYRASGLGFSVQVIVFRYPPR